MKEFFAELQRRNVYKVAVAYAVIAWLLIQAGSILFPTFEAPGWVMKVLITLIAAGFVIALIIAWAFEMTPQGLKPTGEISPNERLPSWSRRKFAAVIVSIAVAAGALYLFQHYRTEPDSASRRSVGLLPPEGISEKSVAVLPFNNLSRDPDNAFFVEGVQDEILTRLAKVADLKVIARTSTQKFKSSPNNLSEIARQLGVAHLLEGSVQKVGDQVRVNVQLINAMTETHLWAETYDRKLTDIFAVESEIAKTIADMLQAHLSGAEKHAIAKMPTVNPEAYELYVKGRYFWNRRTEPNLRKAIGLFEQAIAKDPAYALPYAGLADCHGIMPNYSDDPPRPHIDRAIVAARRAIELDDSLAEAHTGLANGLASDLQFAAAEAEFKRAFALNPNYASAHQWYGETLQSLGRFDEAIAELRRARELDPLSLIINAIFAGTLYSGGKHEEALQQIQRTLELDANFGVAYYVRAQIHESKGEFEQAIADYRKSGDATPSDQSKAVIACAYARAGNTAEARKILDDLPMQSQRRFVSSYWIAQVQAVLGNKDEAIRLLEKAFDERSIPIGGGGVGGPKIDNRFDSLRGDPRFENLVARFLGEKH
jgi:TolB-like protein/Tfp pilus assembly protein PilF